MLTLLGKRLLQLIPTLFFVSVMIHLVAMNMLFRAKERGMTDYREIRCRRSHSSAMHAVIIRISSLLPEKRYPFA